MPERIHRAALRPLADVATVRRPDALRDGDHHIRMPRLCRTDIREELLRGEAPLRQIDQIRENTRHIAASRRRCGQPPGIAPHDLHHRDRRHRIDRAVPQKLLHCHRNVLCRRTEAGRVVGSHQIVVNRFRDADDAHLPVRAAKICGQLGHRVHRIVSADIEEIPDVPLTEARQQCFVNGGILLRIRQLPAAGTERRRRGLGQEPQLLLAVHCRAQIDQAIRQKAVNPVAHSIERSDSRCRALAHPADYARQRCVDCRSRSAALSDNCISDQMFHVKSPFRILSLFYHKFPGLSTDFRVYRQIFRPAAYTDADEDYGGNKPCG